MLVFGSWFVEYVKHEGTLKAFENFQLVIQEFNYQNCFHINAPTVHRASQRLFITIAVIDSSLKAITLDVSHAYVPSETTFKRPVLWSHLNVFNIWMMCCIISIAHSTVLYSLVPHLLWLPQTKSQPLPICSRSLLALWQRFYEHQREQRKIGKGPCLSENE